MPDPNEEAVKGSIKDANLPQFPDFTEIRKELKEKAAANIQHSWRQRGPFLVCTTCEYEHTQWVGPLKKLTGFKQNGEPIIDDVSFR